MTFVETGAEDLTGEARTLASGEKKDAHAFPKCETWTLHLPTRAVAPNPCRLVGLLAVLLIRLLVLSHLLSGWVSLHPGDELLRGS